jgi:hypothetical protein
MKSQEIDIKKIKVNPSNPRLIKDENFKKLVQSIQEFPEMLDIRPIVVNKDMVILGGNMRFKACVEAGLKKIPVIIADNLTLEQEREFLIKDNVSGGEWDWSLLQMDWDNDKLKDWGVDVPKFADSPDYSILDDNDSDIQEQMNEMTDGVKKAIQIEFEAEHYPEANELVKFWREKGLYIGGLLMEKLKEEKDKL